MIDQLASVNWRQTRLVGLETAPLDAQLSVQSKAVDQFEGDDADPYIRMVYAWHALARKSEQPKNPEALAETFDVHCLELVRRYITTLDRQYRNTLLNLRQYRKDFAPPQHSPEPNEPKNLPSPAPVDTPVAAETPEKHDPEAPAPTLIRSTDATRTTKPVLETKDRTNDGDNDRS